ncbi:MAG TPA: MDR family MFS transporter [Actinomycetales bacterium]|jgi:EmrB/QacA subfamily drug resistance transporter|nr:MDR family MFS transporter [Actinomycetales bacterium]
MSSSTKTRREVLVAMSGLMLGMLTTVISMTVVGASLPVIIHELRGTQAAYTWVVTASLLATTVSTPIWGKLADLTSRKVLLQVSLLLFVAASALAGLSQSSGWLIGFRVLQGLGGGGVMALATVIMADLISPRERGRYMGIFGAVMSVGTVGGPLLGGVLTDTVGWRWNFYVGVPLAAVAILVLQRTLHLPPLPGRRVRLDVPGAVLISAGVSLLLVWVSVAGHSFDWASWQSAAMVVGALALLALAVWVEARADEPMIPLQLFRNRTVVTSVIGSAGVGVVMFGATVFLAQYLQLARGKTPTESGLMTAPLVLGSLVASTVIGQLVSRTGRYKGFMLGGALVMTAGMALLGTIREDTPYAYVAAYMALVGAGMGASMQNLVLATQNTVPIRDMGAATAVVTFFRSLGGAVGVAALGAVLGSRVTTLVTDGLTRLGVPVSAMGGGATTVPAPSSLPPAIRAVVEHAYGKGVAELFLVSVPLGLVAVIAIAFMPAKPLGTRSGLQQRVEQQVRTDPERAAGGAIAAAVEGVVDMEGDRGGEQRVTGAVNGHRDVDLVKS